MPRKGIQVKLLALLALSVVLYGCKTPSMLVSEEEMKGDAFNNQYLYEQALPHYKNGLKASTSLGTYRNLETESRLCRKIAQVHSVQGRFPESIRYLSLALELDSSQNDILMVIEDYRELGKTYLYMGDFLHGTSHLERALELNEGMDQSLKGRNLQSIAETYLTLSQLYTTLGRFPEAEHHALQALDIYTKLNTESGEMESLLQLGKIAIQQGSVSFGERYLTASLDLTYVLELSSYRQLEALAMLHENRGDYEEALRMKLRALDEAEQSRNIPQVIWAHILIGDLYENIGDNQMALDHYLEAKNRLDTSQVMGKSLDASINMRTGSMNEAYDFFSESGSQVAAGIASLKIGGLALDQNQTGLAMESFNNALSHFGRAGTEDGITRALMMKGFALTQMDSLTQAQEALTLASQHQFLTETGWQLYYTLGLLYEELSMPDSAIEAYTESIRIIEQIRGNFSVEEFKNLYLQDKVDVYDRLINLLLYQNRVEESLQISEHARARTFLDMLANSRLDVKNSSDAALVRQEQDLRQEIQSMTQLLHESEIGLKRGFQMEVLETSVEQLREQYLDVIRQLKLFNPEYASMVSIDIPAMKELLPQIPDSTVFLSYWIGSEESFVWLIERNGVTSRHISLGEMDIIQLVTGCRDNLGSENHRKWCQDLYNYLIRPFETELSNYSTLGIIPHRALHFLPFHALMPGDDSYMADQFELFVIPSLNVYTNTLQKKLYSDMDFMGLAMGGAAMGGFPGLPGTVQEVSMISTLFDDPVTRYGFSSTETFFKQNAGPFRLVHFATHGIMNQRQPFYSYLLLSPSEVDDGLLTVEEIFGIQLNAELVVLSACETGLGGLDTGDELIGLSRAFIYAGTRNVVVSLWSVPDEPTSYLMNRLYINLDNLSPAGALKRAQNETRAKYPHPSDWAPFILIGSGIQSDEPHR